MARRRYQVGSLILRGKTWVGRWREDMIATDGAVHRVRRAQVIGSLAELPTQKLARRRLELVLAKINAPSYRPGRTASLAEFVERWRAEFLSQRKPSTIKSTEVHIRRHILPRLGALRIEQIGIENQQSFVCALSKVLKRKSVLNVLGTLSVILNTAKRWGYVTESVGIRSLSLPPRGERATPRFFSAEEARRIIAAATEPLSTICAVAAMTGMRSGEIFGLKVSDVDFERRLVFVRRSLWNGKLFAPKSNSSVRVLPLPDPLAQRLKRFLLTWQPNPAGLFFASWRGTPVKAHHLVQRSFRPLLQQLGLPSAGFHAFRHTHSSLLVEGGAPATIAQAQLGHSDPRITLAIYSHVIGDSHRQAVEKLAAVLDSSGLAAKLNQQMPN